MWPWKCAGDCLVIVLVDKCKLRHSLEDAGRLSPPACCCGLIRFSYRGHYIVLTGFDDRNGMFKMEDPSSPCSSVVSPADLESARLAFGTDEDLLVVSKCQKPVVMSSGQTCAKTRCFAAAQSNVFLSALHSQDSNTNPAQRGSAQGLNEAKPAQGIVQTQRVVQMSNRDASAIGMSI